MNDISSSNIGIGLYVYSGNSPRGKGGRSDAFLAKIYFVGVIRRFETETERTMNLAIST